MDDLPSLRASHPCVARRCGHPDRDHVRTPELESLGETVIWCPGCRRHEVRPARAAWFSRRPRGVDGRRWAPTAS